jgi:hypothetical protein
VVAPSGEKATERTWSLCALCFSALSSKEAVASVGVLSLGPGEEYGGLTLIVPTILGAPVDGFSRCLWPVTVFLQ